MTMWENIDKTRTDSAHYSVMRQSPGVKGMDALRDMFPEARCNDFLDNDSNLPHLAQAAWNCLAALELIFATKREMHTQV